MSTQDKRARGAGAESAPKPPSIASAAAALQAELERFEELVAGTCRVPLDSHKHLDQAAQTAQDAATSQVRFGECLKVLIEAVGNARDRQQSGADKINERIAQINERAKDFAAMRERFAGLGEQARGINALVSEVVELKKSATSAEASHALLERLREVQSRMDEVVSLAHQLVQDARDRGMVDLAREADSLRQQVFAARNKVNLLAGSLGAGGSEGAN